MGCDIHLHTEVKIDGQWHHYSAPSVGRWYALFAFMADVRNNGDITPIAPQRGLPADASTVTKLDAERWGGDGHSHSWLSAAEILKVEEWLKGESAEPFRAYDTFGYLFGNSWGGFTKWPEDNPKWLEDVRFVFWFDN